MYCVINCNEGSIAICGYTSTEEEAELYIRNLLSTDSHMNVIVDVSKQDFFDRYVFIRNNAGGKMVKELTRCSFEVQKDEQIQKYINNCVKRDETYTLKRFMTDCCFDKGFQTDTKYQNIENELLKNQNIETVRDILYYLASNYAGRCEFGPRVTEIDTIYAIVQMKSL